MCVFRETLSTNHFTELRSVSNATWRVGFTRNGRPMSAVREVVRRRQRRRRRRQRCFQFLKRGAELSVDWRRLRRHWPPVGSAGRQHIVEARSRRRRRRRRRRVWMMPSTRLTRAGPLAILTFRIPCRPSRFFGIPIRLFHILEVMGNGIQWRQLGGGADRPGWHPNESLIFLRMNLEENWTNDHPWWWRLSLGRWVKRSL